MQLKTLPELGAEAGTDKHHLHRYCEFYHELLSPFRHLPITFVEIGVLGGNSLVMWDKFFTHPDSRFYGLDIHDVWFPPEGTRMKVIIGDASKAEVVDKIVAETGPIDFLWDDGGHFSFQQKESLRLFWPHLKSKGIYCCEDVHTSFHVPWTMPEEQSFVDHTMEWIKRAHEHGAGHCGIPTETDIEEIVIRKSIHVFKKR